MPNSPKIRLGILGGGQLGRMSAQAAKKLNIETIIFCPEKYSPASYVSDQTIIAEYDNEEALKAFSEMCDFISYEFENIPIKTVDYLEKLKPDTVFPKKQLLEVSQDRIVEKSFLNDLGIETADWKAICSAEDIDADDFIIKTARFGYDGKGQIKSHKDDPDLLAFFDQHQGQDLILEHIVDFKCEISVVIARDKNGKTETYGPMLNEHKNHILHHTYHPAMQHAYIDKKAREFAQEIANAVQLRGVLTVEYFVANDGELLVDEIAPRTHNSGHWSIDACVVSQFENHVRCVCGLDVLAPVHHEKALMINLIGDDLYKIDDFKPMANAHIHLYGKKDARPGRKMGHITVLNPEDIDYDALIQNKET